MCFFPPFCFLLNVSQFLEEGRKGKKSPPFIWVKLWNSLGQVWDKTSLFPEEHCHTSTPINVSSQLTYLVGIRGSSADQCMGGPL